MVENYTTSSEATIRIPPYEKENKASSGAEDDAKSAEVGSCEVGYQSDLSRGQSSAQVGKFDKHSVILCLDWCNIMHSLV